MNKMKAINRIITILFIGIFVKCQSQNIESNIIGKWDAVKKEIDNNKDFKTLDGNDPIADMSFIIYKGKLDVIESEIPFKDISYQVIEENHKQVLIFGNRRYYIEKLEGNELVLLEDSDILPARLYFKRSIN